MAQTTTGAKRRWGQTAMKRFSELRRQAAVASSELTEDIPATDADFPRLVSVIRRERSTAGTPQSGIDGTWALVAGLTNLTGRVRTNGRWTDSATGMRARIGDAERIVLVLDVPAAGNGQADEILLTDRLSFNDPLKGTSVWQVKQVIGSSRDGVLKARVEYVREDHD